MELSNVLHYFIKDLFKQSGVTEKKVKEINILK